MLAMNTRPVDPDWLPNFDLHEEDGELVLHAETHGRWGEVEVSVDGGDLIVQAQSDAVGCNRLPLPFPLQARPAVYRPSPEILEVRIRIPDGVRSGA